MSKKVKINRLIFAVIFCISICTIGAAAIEDDGNVSDATAAPLVTEAPPVVTEAPPVVTQAPTEAPVVTQKPTAAPKPTKSAVQYVAPATKRPTSSYVAPATSAQSADPAQPATSAPKANLYDIKDEDVDTDTLKKRDWKDIENILKSADENEGDDSDSFDFIKKNDKKNDNGEWIFYLGIAFEVIAAGIIITLIVLAVRRKKKIKNSRHGGNPPSAPAGNQRHAPKGRPAQAQAQRSASSRQVKKRSKYDTDEIYIPKSRKQPDNGRYRPKH